MSDELGAAEGEPPRLRIGLVLATSTGGVGRHVRALAGELAAAHHHVQVVGPAPTDERFGFAAVDGVGFAVVDIRSGIAPLADLRAVAAVSTLTRDFDVVHAHGLRAGVVAALALRVRARAGLVLRGRAPVRRPVLVVTLHNGVLGSGVRRRVFDLVVARLARTADAIQAVSPDLVEVLLRSRPDAARALVASPLPAPTRDRAATRRHLGVADTTPLILAVGRLHRQKGFDVLVVAASLLADVAAEGEHTGPALAFVIAGEGPQRAELQSRIRVAHVDVRLLGDRDDVADLIQAADVVVMPSRWEGWPLAAAEVLAAGRPFVASAVGGLPELVAAAAILVPPGDAGALAGAIWQLVDDPSLADRLSNAASARAQQLPTISDVTASVLATYRRALVGT
jgi:glycosyltransferase involved in cell wall biosynthesis